MELIPEIEAAFPNFGNWPVICTNQNIASEDRISVIKKKFIQKDQIKYLSFIRDNVSDMSMLDEFIQATVIQNNRVKEKIRSSQ